MDRTKAKLCSMLIFVTFHRNRLCTTKDESVLEFSLGVRNELNKNRTCVVDLHM